MNDLRQAMDKAFKENPKLFERKVDNTIELALRTFFQNRKGSPSLEELEVFVSNLIDTITIDFEDSTERKDVRTRIDEFYLKMYTLKTNSRFQELAPQELYVRVLEFLQTEEEPTGKRFNPDVEEKRGLNEDELRKKDYDIRIKIFQDRINNKHGSKLPLSYASELQTICEAFEEQPGNTVSLDFGRMNTLEAAFVTETLFGLGYRANFEEVMKGKVCAQKIPLVMQKREIGKSGQQLGKESIGIYNEPCFTQDVSKKISDYVQSLDDIEQIFTGRTDEGDFDL